MSFNPLKMYKTNPPRPRGDALQPNILQVFRRVEEVDGGKSNSDELQLLERMATRRRWRG